MAAAFVLFSPAFRSGGPLPQEYGCAGAGGSPPLRWTTPPRGTRSLALSVVDSDANGFVHWLAWGISPGSRGLAAGRHAAREGTDDYGWVGWGAPCPPMRKTHHYVFDLYALRRPLALGTGSNGRAFFRALEAARPIARARLVTTFVRA